MTLFELIDLICWLTEETVALKTYEATLAGYIGSWVDRFRSNGDVCNILEAIWEEDKKYYPSLIKNWNIYVQFSEILSI